MRVSISVTSFSWPSGPGGLGAELVRLARAADQSGVDTVWVADHRTAALNLRNLIGRGLDHHNGTWALA
jgi:alkanesulfonate monooxygenase SsuD/methylene tetrahydromethanopterin reductase-like flavin-dependent oxidoreductase (luciferase family)